MSWFISAISAVSWVTILRIAAPSVPYGERDIALSKKIAENIKIQLLCAVLISLLVGIAVLYYSFLLGGTLLDKTAYNTEGTFYFYLFIFSGLLALIAFALCFMALIGRKVAYIILLKKELDILSGGHLEHPVTIIGKDELGELALGIDQMRRSMIKHQETESQMRSANSELITAMSHDLRTPLTSLLAYLEIIERKKYQDEQQRDELIHKSVGQTMRIKQMADELFSYFLAYATEWEAVDMETVDADQLFHQILSDYAYALESNGMRVDTDFAQVSADIIINTELLHRALDNLYSNLLKYADPKETIRVSYKRKEQNILISISNGIRTEQIKTNSTKLGLVTCRRIIECHKGHFTTAEENNRFHVTLSIPVQRNQEQRKNVRWNCSEVHPS